MSQPAPAGLIGRSESWLSQVERGVRSVDRLLPHNPGARQVQFVHAVLRNALAHAEREELISWNVAKLVQAPSPRYKIGQGLTLDEVRRLLLGAVGHRLYPLYVVAATMGFRRGELLSGDLAGPRDGIPVVQAIAWHADVKIMLKIYAHTNLDEMRSAFGKLDGTLE